MKCFILLTIVCATIGFSEQAISKEQVIEMFKKMAEECAGKEGATAADLQEAAEKKLPSTPSGKCMHACVLEKIGFLKDNKGNMEGYVGLAKEVFGNDVANIQKATEIANECANVSDTDRCEAAFKVVKCADAAAQARGVSLCFGEW
ncbi:general odorant-binding protein 28a-like [Sitodiplosis mosellana]|uniref:general odorant-binding protein 28a-like n=1 Tax=Sitodiplosis mosellana TaxID=263140 RepID=UPI002444EB35|nr:general odorant-binding protein 28a-like [Sitodiplosis mosellana]